jgi:hypothetical protein
MVQGKIAFCRIRGEDTFIELQDSIRGPSFQSIDGHRSIVMSYCALTENSDNVGGATTNADFSFSSRSPCTVSRNEAFIVGGNLTLNFRGQAPDMTKFNL